MKRSIEIDGKMFRERRGVLVEIPKKMDWTNTYTTNKTQTPKQNDTQAKELCKTKLE